MVEAISFQNSTRTFISYKYGNRFSDVDYNNQTYDYVHRLEIDEEALRHDLRASDGGDYKVTWVISSQFKPTSQTWYELNLADLQS